MLYSKIKIFLLVFCFCQLSFAGEISDELLVCMVKSMESRLTLPDGAKALGSEKMQSTFQNMIKSSEVSDHKFKHNSSRKNKLSEKETKKLSISTGEAQYLATIDNKALEKEVLLSKDGFYRSKGNNFFKYIKLDKVIGYDGKEATQWMRVEWTSGTVHGHPMSIERVKEQCSSCFPKN
jgi:hypothetical protein